MIWFQLFSRGFSLTSSLCPNKFAFVLSFSTPKPNTAKASCAFSLRNLLVPQTNDHENTLLSYSDYPCYMGPVLHQYFHCAWSYFELFGSMRAKTPVFFLSRLLAASMNKSTVAMPIPIRRIYFEFVLELECVSGKQSNRERERDRERFLAYWYSMIAISVKKIYHALCFVTYSRDNHHSVHSKHWT